MLTSDERADLLLDTLNKAVTMLLEVCNVNKGEESKSIVKNRNSNSNQRKIINNKHRSKKCLNIKKVTRTTAKNLVRYS
jgi:hypothetical protein